MRRALSLLMSGALASYSIFPGLEGDFSEQIAIAGGAVTLMTCATIFFMNKEKKSSEGSGKAKINSQFDMVKASAEELAKEYRGAGVPSLLLACPIALGLVLHTIPVEMQEAITKKVGFSLPSRTSFVLSGMFLAGLYSGASFLWRTDNRAEKQMIYEVCRNNPGKVLLAGVSTTISTVVFMKHRWIQKVAWKAGSAGIRYWSASAFGSILTATGLSTALLALARPRAQEAFFDDDGSTWRSFINRSCLGLAGTSVACGLGAAASSITDLEGPWEEALVAVALLSQKCCLGTPLAARVVAPTLSVALSMVVDRWVYSSLLWGQITPAIKVALKSFIRGLLWSPSFLTRWELPEQFKPRTERLGMGEMPFWIENYLFGRGFRSARRKIERDLEDLARNTLEEHSGGSEDKVGKRRDMKDICGRIEFDSSETIKRVGQGTAAKVFNICKLCSDLRELERFAPNRTELNQKIFVGMTDENPLNYNSVFTDFTPGTNGRNDAVTHHRLRRIAKALVREAAPDLNYPIPSWRPAVALPAAAPAPGAAPAPAAFLDGVEGRLLGIMYLERLVEKKQADLKQANPQNRRSYKAKQEALEKVNEILARVAKVKENKDLVLRVFGRSAHLADAMLKSLNKDEDLADPLL